MKAKLILAIAIPLVIAAAVIGITASKKDKKQSNEAPSKSQKPSSNTAAENEFYTRIAQEVIAGHWGNGAERKANLEAAGYDYYKIQQIVNQLLK